MSGLQIPTMLRLQPARLNPSNDAVKERQYRTAAKGQHLIAASGDHVLAEAGSVVLATGSAVVVALKGSKVTSLDEARVEEHSGSRVIRVIECPEAKGYLPVAAHEKPEPIAHSKICIVAESPLQASAFLLRLDSLKTDSFSSDILLQLRYQFMHSASAKQVRPLFDIAKFFPRFEIKYRDKFPAHVYLGRHVHANNKRLTSSSQILRAINPNYIKDAS